MRVVVPPRLEQGRLSYDAVGPYNTGKYSPPGHITGVFMVRGPTLEILRIIATHPDEEIRYEHVSVSLERRCPTWDEMAFVKDLFWREDECVIQYHPPKSQYVNCHPYTLHLWKPVDFEIPLPPMIAV